MPWHFFAGTQQKLFGLNIYAFGNNLAGGDCEIAGLPLGAYRNVVEAVDLHSNLNQALRQLHQ